MTNPDDVSQTSPVVDLHAHFMPPDLPDLAAETGDDRWPMLFAHPDALTGSVMRGPQTFRVVRRPCWDTAARLGEMDALGVDVQVISPIPVALTYWAEPKLGLRYARHINDWLAQTVGEGRGRLRGLGTVPLQDPTAAVSELKRCVEELGLDGLELGTVVGTTELDAQELRPFFAAAEELQTPLFIHPMDTRCVSRAASVDLSFGIGMMTDTALAAGALVFGGVLEDFPGLRICLSHGGGGLPWMWPRLKFGRSISQPGLEAHWDELVGRFYVDSLVFDPQHLDLLRTRFGIDHIVAGSDYPFLPNGPSPQSILEVAAQRGLLSAEELRAVRSGNALEFLGRRIAGAV
ncbi:amidohydrolase family protein [Rhodococcus sp. 27YEA15]|uniref:amidohydrolase family protein n=1 Tax=Rhodococcus sp. 27YEA15 TaxID=3156259 RepID=UPI003C7AA014